MRQREWLLVTVGCFATTCLVGCSGGDLPVYTAGGRVEFSDGTAITVGQVEFRPVEAPQPIIARGQIQTDGSFQLSTFEPGDGAIVGLHRAIVRPIMVFDHDTHEPVVAIDIDKRFGNYETSGLSFTVTENPAENEFTLVVEHPGG